MQKKVLLKICLIVFSTLFQTGVMAYSAGPPDGHNGQPPTEASCGIVAQCHGSDADPYVGIEISIAGNPAEYIPGEVYNIEVFISDPFSSCFGFQCGAQFENAIENAGAFALNSDNEGMAVSETGSFQYVEHNEPSINGKWNFLWIAPGGSALDNVVFYAAGVVADCNGEPVNDITYTASKKFSSNCQNIEILPVMEYYAILPRCDYSRTMPSIAVDFEPVTGGSGPYTLFTEGNSITDKTTLNEGDTFTYFYTLSDIENNTVGVTVFDADGHTCKLEDDLITLLSSIPVNDLCDDMGACEDDINAEYRAGAWNGIFNCDAEQEKLTLTIDRITGTNYNYNEVLSLDGTEVVWDLPSDEPLPGFAVSFTQAQIDALQVGFKIEFSNGCLEIFDLNDRIGNANINEICNLAVDDCNEAIRYTIDGGMETPVIRCNPLNPTNPIYTINVNNVGGGDGSYIVTAKGGTLTKSSLVEGERFTYIITKSTIEANNVELTIDDENGCSRTLNFNETFANYDLEALCQCVINYEFEKEQNTNLPLVVCEDENNGMLSAVIKNINGGLGNYNFSSSRGEVTTISTTSFKINFTKADYESGNLDFIISSSGCVLTQNLSDLLTIDLEMFCLPPPPCTLQLELVSKIDLTCKQPTASIVVGYTAGNDEVVTYTWLHNNNPLPLNSDVGINLAPGTYIIGAEDANGCQAESIFVVIDELKELKLNYNQPHLCSADKQFYEQTFNLEDANGEIAVTTSAGSVEYTADNIFTVNNIPSGEAAIVEINDEAGCAQTVNIGPNTCLTNPPVDCDANAGAMLPVPFDVFCTLNANVSLPIQYGYNTSFDYMYIITDEDLNIVGFSDDSKIDISGNAAGTYCIHGVSYNKRAENAPDFTAPTLTDLYNQPNVCFDIILDDCIEIEIQEATANPATPIGLEDTLFLCTGYITPIDFCIPITDEDGGQPYLVDIKSFCNPTIEGDNCVHYPPLPGLVVGTSETLSLIFCDDDCPQKCDTSYVNVAIRDDCTDFELDFDCGADSTTLCTTPGEPIDLCVECNRNADAYFIDDIRSTAGADFEVLIFPGNCIQYLPNNETYNDLVEIDVCLWDNMKCTTKVFEIEVKENCEDIREDCIEKQVCTPPSIEIEICFDCEFSKYPEAKITDIDSKFDNCTTNEIREMCFDYIPLPLMHLVGIDTVVVTYCNPDDECYTANTYLTFEDCDGVPPETIEPKLSDVSITIEANNDYFELINKAASVVNVLENDAGNNVNSGEVYINIITAPQYGEIIYNNSLSNISYIPNTEYTGSDSFIYEICNNGACDRATANINVMDKILENYLNISPNPASDNLNINLTNASDKKIITQLFNAAGIEVYRKQDFAVNKQYNSQINLTGFERGIYFVRIIEGKKINTEKIIVQ